MVTGIVANAEPYSDKLLGVEGNSEYVLEVNGGFCAKNGIKARRQDGLLGILNSHVGIVARFKQMFTRSNVE